jgi:hypothetical protein
VLGPSLAIWANPVQFSLQPFSLGFGPVRAVQLAVGSGRFGMVQGVSGSAVNAHAAHATARFDGAGSDEAGGPPLV